MQQFIRLGTQFLGYRDHANSLEGTSLISFLSNAFFPFYFVVTFVAVFPEALAKANKRADDLALELAKSEKAREKAERESASVESLRKRLHDTENTLSEHTSQQLAREAGIAARLESQNRRFVSKYSSLSLHSL
jgi:F0F1-type ATP synthase membrane subunit b/b'